MPELQLGIFASYALKKEEILRILKMARRENGVNETGLGSRKATTFKAWAVRSGLIDKKTGHLTPQGQIVLAYDPQLQSSVTDWLMHFYLSFGDNGLATPPANAAEWGGWTWFIYIFLPTHPSFIRTNLEIAACNIYETEKKKAKNIVDKINYILRAYTETEGNVSITTGKIGELPKESKSGLRKR